MKKVASIFSVLFFLATICTIAFADAVPGALLYLDARENPAHPRGWWNLGTVGGVLSGDGKPPELEVGTIAIPALGIDKPDSRFYTHKRAGQAWGGPDDDLELFIEDWTLEFLFKLEGENHKDARGNQFAGFQPGGHNSIRLSFWFGQGDLGAQFSDGGAGQLRPGRDWTEDGWIWLTLTSAGGDFVRVYHDAKMINMFLAGKFDKTAPIKAVIIGANSYAERGQSFTGSIALVRLYDKVLDKNQINQNITAWIEWRAVDPASKLTTTWGRVKTR